MNKKIFMLLFFLLVLMSMSAISAADLDDNNDTVVLSDDAEILSAANDVDAIGDLNGTVGAVVNESNFFNYFDESGTLLPNATGELIFEGDFSDLNLNYITIDAPVKFTGNDAVFDDITFVITSDNVVIDGFTVSQTADLSAFNIWGVSDVTLSNNIIEFAALEGFDSYAVYAAAVQNFNLINNYISYLGNTDGTVVNNAVRIEGDDDEDNPVPASNIVVSGNTFDLKIPSVDEGYNPDAWASMVMNEGIVFYFCEDLEFVDNRIDLKYNEFKTQGGFDSLYAISVTSDQYSFGDIQSNYIKIADNTINIEGHAHVYAISLCADNLNVTGNTITATAETNLAHGIDINGPSQTGIVSKNNINVESPSSSYGIHSYQYMGAIEDIVYSGNTVNVTGYVSVGMEIVECNPEITGNVIVANGNYTDGIVASIRDEGEVTGNIITVLGSNIGEDSTGDHLIPKNSIGISVKGDFTIEGNTIESTNIGIILFDNSKFTINDNNIKVETNALINSYGIYSPSLENLIYLTITDNTIYTTCEYSVNIVNATGTVNSNYLISEKFLGDDSVCYNGSVSVYSNTPILVSDLVKVYGVNQSLIVFAVDEDGIPMSNVTLIATIGSIQFEVTTDDNGQAGFLFEKLTPGNYTANIGFNNIYVGAVATINVVVIIGESVITVPDVTKYYGGPEKLEITLTENDLDLPIVGVNVTIKIDGGNDIIKTTDSEGKAYVDLDLNVGDYNAKVSYQNKNVEAKITVNKCPTNIALENVAMALKVNDNVSSGATLTSADAGNLTYTSSNESIVIVENGIIKALHEGTATITVSFYGTDVYAAAENRTITVNVALNDVSVSVNNSTLDLSVGDKFTIVADTVPNGLNVTFIPDDSGVVSVDENGVVTALKGGTASIIVKVGGDGVYAENSTVVNITVNKLSAEIVIVNDTLNVTVLNFTSAGASLDPAGAGDLTYTSSNESVVIVENGMIKAIGEGTAIITVSFEGNDFYAAAENRTITVNVGLNDASVSVNNSTLDLFVGDNFTIVAATVPEGLAVSFSSSNESVATVDADGKIVAVGIGSAIITVSVGGEGIYALNSTTVAVNIVKKDLNISAYTFTMSGNVTLIIVGFENATGNVTMTVGENNYNSSIMMGMAFVSIPKSDENVTAYVYYPGDDNYCNASTSVVIVAKKDLNITITADPICIGQNATVIVSGLENATGNVTVIAGRSFSNATIINGTATAIISGLNKTTMVIVFYMGDNTYNMAFASVNITVKENLTISASADPIFVGENATVVITGLKNATENVSVRAGGKIYFAAIVNGTAKVVIPALSESIIGYVDYAGDENYAASNTTVQITVNKINIKISANAITATYNVNKNLVITLKDAKGNALGRVSITVNLNGVKTYTTNNNGQIKINVAKLVPKAYTAKITFAGNNKYAASSANVKVTVKKAKSTITAKKKTFKKAKKTKKYSITLKSGKTAIKKVQVTLKIKGKTYKAKTNNKGKATFKIKKLTKKGTFKATIKFKGNKYYKSVAKKVKIKIK